MANKKQPTLRAVVNSDGATKGGRMTPAPSAAYISIPKPAPKPSSASKAPAPRKK